MFLSNRQNLDHTISFVDVVEDANTVAGTDTKLPTCTEWRWLTQCLPIRGFDIRLETQLLTDFLTDEGMVFRFNRSQVLRDLGSERMSSPAPAAGETLNPEKP